MVVCGAVGDHRCAVHQALDLVPRKAPGLPLWQRPQDHGADPDPAQVVDLVPHLLEAPPDLPFPALAEDNAEAAGVAIALDDVELGR